MKIYRIAYTIASQVLFAIITVFLVYGIFDRDLIITSLSFAARSCLHWMSIENHALFQTGKELRRSSHRFFR